MLLISRIKHAQIIWKQFYSKYSDVSAELSTKRKYAEVSQDFIDEIAQNHDEYSKAAIRIQSLWRGLRCRDTLISVNPNADHSGEFNHLVNYNPLKNNGVRRSLNKLKQDILLEAIEQGNWEASILNDATLPQLALSLFDSGSISQQQIYTLLEHHQTLKDYPLIKHYPILNTGGSFSKEAIEHLLPCLQNRSNLEGLCGKEIEEFRLMIAALPKSEQMFYLTGCGKLNEQKKSTQLGHKLIKLDGIFLANIGLLHISSGARDALGLVKFGLENYVRPMPRLGSMWLTDIERGVKHRARYAALNYPNTKPYGNIHDYDYVNDLEATSHDVYHGNVMSTIPENFLKALNRFTKISRKHTNIKWSLEIWDWIDCDYTFFFHKLGKKPDTSDLSELTLLFCHMLDYGNGTTIKEISRGGSVLRDNKPTPLGILIFIDMVTNRPKWIEMGINPDYLSGAYGIYYRIINNHYDTSISESDPTVIQVLKAQALIELGHSIYWNSFSTVNEIITEEQNKLINQLSFCKRPKVKYDSYSNTIDFKLNDAPVSIYSLYKIIEDYYEKHSDASMPSVAKICFAIAIIEHGLNKTEACVYTNQKLLGKTDSHAKFIAKPTLMNWLLDNIIAVSLLSFTLVAIPFILAVGLYKVHQAKRNYPSITATDKPSLQSYNTYGFYSDKNDHQTQQVGVTEQYI